MSNRSPATDPTAVLAAHWNESERRLYPVATTNPDAYQSAVRLVRAVADALAEVEDLDALAEQWERRSDVVDGALRVTGDIAGYRLPEPEIAGAGFAMRRRELLAELAERRDLIVFTDEVYEHFVFDGLDHVSPASLPGLRERTVTMSAS